MKSFNVLDRALNVHESYLLEASAGTGKTFSIENIVARLLIEKDPTILLDQILVVTFTKAATSDLKTRIRQNIENALNILTYRYDELKIPDYIQAIIENGDERINEAIGKLKNALFTFDQAQIFTIHSFCSKMLRENVFEGDIRLGSVSDEPTVLKQEILKIIRNFFRTGLTHENFSKNQLNIVLKKHTSKIENLEKALLKWVTCGLETKRTTGFKELFLRFKTAMSLFNLESEKIISDFNVHIVNYRKLKDHETVLSKVSTFASLFEKIDLSEDDFDILIQDGLYILKALDPALLRAKQKTINENDLFYPTLILKIKEHLLKLIEEASSYEFIFSRMVYFCRNMLDRYLKEEEKFRFDDLLTGMNQALKNDCFLGCVRGKYKAAIIDEFQDTDMIQWDIFKTIFLDAIPFYLVGDPKQSIYAFRQADIYTYLKAANSIKQDHRLSLNVNFRSTKPLVAALNALFNNQINPEFIQLPKLQTVLPYPEVESPETAPVVKFPDNFGSLHFFSAEIEQVRQKLPIEDLEESYYFPFMAKQILHLQKNGFRLSQMAILVKDHFQAKRVHTYFKDKKLDISLQRLSSLSSSIMLKYLMELLYAVINPDDESALKTALGGYLIGFSSVDIIALNEPFTAVKTLSNFLEFKKILFSSNYAKFFEFFLQSTWNGFTVAEKLMSYEDGDEYYEELLQISELLIEHQSKTRCTPDSLLNFLNDFKILEFDSDDRIKKLTDPHQDTIKTLTIHSSKGLEFDIVFALGLVNRPPLPDIFIPVQHAEKTVLEPLTDLNSREYINHAQEIDAEKSRQLYVAMTRAKYRLYVPVAFCLKHQEVELAGASCMELFLAKIKSLNDLEIPLYERIKQLNGKKFIDWLDDLSEKFSITHSKLNEMQFSFESNTEEEKVILDAPKSILVENEPVFMHSFTQLATIKLQDKPILGIPHDFDSKLKNQHLLPSGAKTGILLHSILEGLSIENLNDFYKPECFRNYLEPYLSGTKFEDWMEVFQNIVFNVLNCHLMDFQFKDIDPAFMYREKEFIYSTESKNGFLKGVIDLFFMHNGKYYFLDWKSNWIGSSCADYTESALRHAMIKHDYYLQADIYKEATRRFLNIVDDRPFDDCFGGIFYVFLRGLDANNPSSGILHLT